MRWLKVAANNALQTASLELCPILLVQKRFFFLFGNYQNLFGLIIPLQKWFLWGTKRHQPKLSAPKESFKKVHFLFWHTATNSIEFLIQISLGPKERSFLLASLMVLFIPAIFHQNDYYRDNDQSKKEQLSTQVLYFADQIFEYPSHKEP